MINLIDLLERLVHSLDGHLRMVRISLSFSINKLTLHWALAMTVNGTGTSNDADIDIGTCQ